MRIVVGEMYHLKLVILYCWIVGTCKYHKPKSFLIVLLVHMKLLGKLDCKPIE